MRCQLRMGGCHGTTVGCRMTGSTVVLKAGVRCSHSAGRHHASVRPRNRDNESHQPGRSRCRESKQSPLIKATSQWSAGSVRLTAIPLLIWPILALPTVQRSARADKLFAILLRTALAGDLAVPSGARSQTAGFSVARSPADPHLIRAFISAGLPVEFLNGLVHTTFRSTSMRLTRERWSSRSEPMSEEHG